MFRQALLSIAVGVLVFGTGHAAFGGARIDLRPDPLMPPGGYAPNTIINVEVFMVDTGNPQGDIPFLGIALDFADTAGTLSFPGADMVAGNEDDNLFSWLFPPPDFFSVVFPELPYTVWTTGREPPEPQYAITMPDEGEVQLGSIAVDVGLVGGVLDVLNADEPSASRGAAATGGFFPDPLFTWEAFPGELTDGRLNVVVPEPATVGLLLIGATCVGVRRARRRAREAATLLVERACWPVGFVVPGHRRRSPCLGRRSLHSWTASPTTLRPVRSSQVRG